MPTGLKRYQHEGDLHFITFSCYRRKPYLSEPGTYATVEQALEETRKRHSMEVHGYVFMPEHLHLLLSEPPETVLADGGWPTHHLRTLKKVAGRWAGGLHTTSRTRKSGCPIHRIVCDVWVPVPSAKLSRMPTGLKRYQHEGDLHFVTFSCYRRLPYLAEPGAYATVEQALEEIRKRHTMEVHGYVFMPEHLHLLVSEPPNTVLADALKYFKWRTSRQLKGSRPKFWQARYYDFNVYTHDKRIEKLRYMHRNPVKRGLVPEAKDWPWSSFNHYMSNHPTHIHLTQTWR